MQLDDDSRIMNEFARTFLRKKAPARMGTKQIDLLLPVSQPKAID
jgi:hypothetical protein